MGEYLRFSAAAAVSGGAKQYTRETSSYVTRGNNPVYDVKWVTLQFLNVAGWDARVIGDDAFCRDKSSVRDFLVTHKIAFENVKLHTRS